MNIKRIFFLFFISFNILNSESSQEKADIIVFSYDRPMQLFAFLETVEKYVKNCDEIWILYRTSSERFDKAYDECFDTFKNLNIKKIKQINDNANDTFKPLLMHCIRSSKNKYILFGVDDIVIKDHINLSECINCLNKTDAYGFYLRLGKNITYCYTEGRQVSVPKYQEVDKGIYSFSFKGEKGDWGYPCSLDMTVYNKERIIDSISKINFHSPNRFEGNWFVNEWFFDPIKDKTGLFFEESKIVNIPLNIVQNDVISRNMGISSLKLLEKFETGLKINTEPFFRIYNKAPHMEFDIVYISKFPFQHFYNAIKNMDLNTIEDLKIKFSDFIHKKSNGNIYNLKDENGYSPLMWASNTNCLEGAKLLIENKVDVNAEDKNQCTALMFACWKGHSDIVELLLKNEANVEAIDVNGTTALAFADQLSSPNREKIISLLIGEE